jgi:hypothetical protein
MTSIFDIDFYRLTRLLLPTFLRSGGALTALLDVLVAPVKSLHELLLSYRGEVAQAMRYSSQTCYLRGALNDLYDAELRRIRVENVEGFEPLMLYDEAEIDELQALLYSEDSGNFVLVPGEDDFIGEGSFRVRVPEGLLAADEARIRASVERYRLATREFVIEKI